MSLELIKDLGRIYPNEDSKQKRRFGIYKCFCGIEFKAQTHYINTNHTKSCGCSIYTHNLSKHRLYNTWVNMIRRCESITDKAYVNYGARGISVCDRWKDVSNFIEDMYPTYREGLTIDRIDVNGNYEPNNCRWVDMKIQGRNTRILKSTNTSGYRGVFWDKSRNKWVARICIDYRKKHIGVFNDAISGAIAYNNYVIENNLEHTLNIIEGV